MTELTQIPPTPLSSHYPPSETQALAGELAKCLKLVAPATMGAEAQTVWLHAAVDALEDIRASEVAAISAEVRRSVSRPAQIVPEIARLVAEKRKRPAHVETEGRESEYAIDQEAQRRRSLARGRAEVEAAWEWERNARIDAGLRVPPLQPPLSRTELDNLSPQITSLGLAYGFLERRGGQLTEAA